MKYVKYISTYTLEVKQSKFIAWLTPYEDYTTTLEELKKEHPKARHFVRAYRYLNEHNQIVESSSDDGEPKGTSGRPCLMVLQGQGLINTALIIVRYFGGTKLGTGGLVRAYSDTANIVITESTLFKYKKDIYKTIEIQYCDIRFIEYECISKNVSIIEKSFDTKSIYKIKADEESMKLFLEKVQRVIKIVL